MELTGARRFIQTTLFATVAWAGYLILFTWSWHGGHASGFPHGPPAWAASGGFPAGNGASIVLGFAAVAFAAIAMQRPTLRHARAASALLTTLVPVAIIELGMNQLIVESRLPAVVHHTSIGVAVRTAVLLIATSGVMLFGVVAMLRHREEKARALVMNA